MRSKIRADLRRSSVLLDVQDFAEEEETQESVNSRTWFHNKASPFCAGLKTLAAAVTTRRLGAENTAPFAFEASEKDMA